MEGKYEDNWGKEDEMEATVHVKQDNDNLRDKSLSKDQRIQYI